MSEVTVTGLAEALAFIRELPQAVQEAGDEITGLAAAMVETEAKRIVPVRTGTLQRSIHTEHPKQGEWTVGSKIHYAGFVEYGTRKMAAQPYLRPAWETVQPRLDPLILDILIEYYAKKGLT